MSISLGDAVLSFAGGAAQAYNEDAVKRRDQQMALENRVSEMIMGQKQRIAETKFTNEYKDSLSRKQHQESIKALGGADSARGQHYINTKIYGQSDTHSLRAIQAGIKSEYDMSTPEDPSRNIRKFYGEMVEGVKDPKIRTRLEGLIGTMDQRGYDIDMGMDDRAKEISERRGVMGSPDFDSIYAADLKAKPQVVNIKEGETLASVDATGNVTELFSKEKPRDMQSAEGQKVADLEYLRNAAEANPDDPAKQEAIARMIKLLEKDDKYSLQKGTTTDEQGRSWDTIVQIEETPDGPMQIGDPLPIGLEKDREGRLSGYSYQRVNELKKSNAQIANFKAGIYKQMSNVTASQEGAAKLITKFTGSVASNLQGLMELAGVPRETTPDRVAQLYADMGLEMDKVVEKLRESNGYLVSMNEQSLGMLAYALGGILKDTGTRKDTSEKDIQRAIEMVGRLGSRDGGLSAANELLYTMDVRQAQNNQMIYQDPESANSRNAGDRKQAGLALIKNVNPNITSDYIIADDSNGEIFFYTNPADQAQARLALEKMQASGDAPATLGEAFERFPENMRPMSLDQAINEYGEDGYLLPMYDEAKYLSKYMEPRR